MFPFSSKVFALAAAFSALAASPVVATTGGSGVPDPADIAGVKCLSQTPPCPARGGLVRGGLAELNGSGLAGTRAVLLPASRRKTVRATPQLANDKRLRFVVPGTARSGSLHVIDAAGERVGSVKVAIAAPPKIKDLAEAGDSGFFYAGQGKPEFRFSAASEMSATVELVRESDGAVVRSWQASAGPGREAVVRWNGRGLGGPQPTGSYRFRLRGPEAAAASISSKAVERFDFYDHVFPIRGKHNLGYSDTNNFGGARNHGGQDMFARCGTPLAAARGGKVRYAGYGGATGNYVVIDGQGTGVDYVYLHLRLPATVRTGDRVYTGERIGEVGETGRAQGCHLHFEMWSEPGWYSGGKAFDPLPQLKVWDSYS